MSWKPNNINPGMDYFKGVGELDAGYLKLDGSNADQTIDIGAQTIQGEGVGIHDSDDSHHLTLKCSTDLAADRIFYISPLVGGNCTLDINSGSISLNQHLETTDSPSFRGLTLTTDGLGSTPYIYMSSGGSANRIEMTFSTALSTHRAFTIATGDAARTITFTGNPTLDDWFDQSVKVAATPTFAELTIDSSSTTALLVEDISGNRNVLVVDTTNDRVGIGGVPASGFDVQVVARLREATTFDRGIVVGDVYADGGKVTLNGVTYAVNALGSIVGYSIGSSLSNVSSVQAMLANTYFRTGGATGVTLQGSGGTLTLAGIGNTYNENLTIDFEPATDTHTITIASGTGVTDIDWSALNHTTTGTGTFGNLVVSATEGLEFTHGVPGGCGMTFPDDSYLRIGAAASQKPQFSVVGDTHATQPGYMYFRYGDSGISFQYTDGSTTTEFMSISSDGKIVLDNNARIDDTLLIQKDANNVGDHTEIKHKVSSNVSTGYYKAGQYFERKLSHARGDFVWALDSIADSGSVVIGDEKMRLSNAGDLTVLGDLDSANMAFEKVGGKLTSITADAVLDDMSVGGTPTATAETQYRVEIDLAAATDTFKWSNDNGSSWEVEDVAITGSAQTLENGITITFVATTGHTLTDKWDFNVGTILMQKNPVYDEDFLIGSPQMWDAGNADHDRRMWFDKSRAAFRAGRVQSTQWDDTNVGGHSAAFGLNCTASGNYSFAAGNSNKSIGDGSFTTGRFCDATGGSSTCMGYNCDTSVDGTYGVCLGILSDVNAGAGVAIGNNCEVTGQYGIAIGAFSEADNFAVALGWATASGTESIAIGTNNVIASAEGAIAIGDNFTNSTASSFAIGWGAIDYHFTATELLFDTTNKAAFRDTNHYIASLNANYIDYVAPTAHRFDTPVRGATSLWYRAVHKNMLNAAPGASGATFIAPNAGTTLGGHILSAAGHELYSGDSITSMWDGASDLSFRVTWEVNEAAAADGDVDLKLVCVYKGDHDVANKTQTLQESHTVTGDKAQYTRHTTVFTIDWDLVNHVVEVGDKISFTLNCEATGEVTNIIVNTVMFRYQTALMNPEI